MLVSNSAVEILFGESEVFIPAKALLNGRDVTHRTGDSVTYFHLLFDKHEVVYAEGIAAETLLLSQASLNGLSCAASREAHAILGQTIPLSMQASAVASNSTKLRC